MISLETTSGSDVTVVVTLTDNSGAINLSGRTLSIFNVSRKLENRVTAQITNAASGIITVKIEGSDPLPVGQHSFRLQVNLQQGGTRESIGLPEFQLSVQ